MGRGGYNGGSTVIHAGSGWFGKGSVTSQPGEKKKRPPAPAKPRRKSKSKPRKSAPGKPRGNGVTIPEKIARAEAIVKRISGEIKQTERQLEKLRAQLRSAEVNAEAARNTPRRSAIGIALQKAQQDRGKRAVT